MSLKELFIRLGKKPEYKLVKVPADAPGGWFVVSSLRNPLHPADMDFSDFAMKPLVMASYDIPNYHVLNLPDRMKDVRSFKNGWFLDYAHFDSDAPDSGGIMYHWSGESIPSCGSVQEVGAMLFCMECGSKI